MNNTEKIIATLKEHGPMTRAQLLRQSGVSNTFEITRKLLKNNVLIKRNPHLKTNSLISLPTGEEEQIKDNPKPSVHPLERHLLSLTFEVSEIDRQLKSLKDARTFLFSRIESITEKLKSL